MANERPTIVDALKQGMVAMFVDSAGAWWPKWLRCDANGNALVSDGFKISAYTGQKATSTTALAEAIDSSASRIRVTNENATAANMVRIGFGTSEAEAISNCASGDIVHAASDKMFGVPALATHIGYVAVAGTPNITISQGV